jgi:hypothetical protein
MLNQLLPDDDIAPLNGIGRSTTKPSSSSADDAQLLRGLLEDGVVLPGSNSDRGGSKANFSLDLDDPLGNDAVEALPLSDTHIDEILRSGLQMRASDVHLSVGIPPMFRVDGKLVTSRYDVVTPREAQRLVYDVLSSENIEKFERTKSWTSLRCLRYRALSLQYLPAERECRLRDARDSRRDPSLDQLRCRRSCAT